MASTVQRPSRVLVFLLDVSRAQSVQLDTRSPPPPSPDRYVEKFASAVERILNYHSSCSDCDLQWCYQLFDSDSCFLSLESRSIPLRPVSQSGVRTFREQLSRRISEASSGTTRPYKEKYAAITRAFEDALRDIEWTPSSDVLSVDSLLGDDDDQQDIQLSPCKSGHSVTPLLYLFSAAPDSIDALGAIESSVEFLDSVENGDSTDHVLPHDSHPVTSELHSSVIHKLDVRVKDELTRIVGILAKRKIGLAWVDSKISLAGMKTPERSRALSAFSKWLRSKSPGARFIDLSSLLLDSRILPTATIMQRVDNGNHHENTGNQEVSAATSKDQNLQWCLADVVFTKPSPLPIRGEGSKRAHPVAPGKQSTTQFWHYFRAQLSSSCAGASGSAKFWDVDAGLTSSDHVVFILRGLMTNNIGDDELFRMRAFESNAQILRPAGHDDPQSDAANVALWTSLFAGLMNNLASTQRYLIADVCVQGSGDSEGVKALFSVLVRPISALSASVRKVALDLTLSRMRLADSITAVSVFGDNPGNLRIQNLPWTGVSETVPEDHFDHYLARHLPERTSPIQTEDIEKMTSIRHCLLALASEADNARSPGHLSGLQKKYQSAREQLEPDCDPVYDIRTSPTRDQTDKEHVTVQDDLFSALESHVRAAKERTVTQKQAAETARDRAVKQQAAEIRAAMAKHQVQLIFTRKSASLRIEQRFGRDNNHNAALSVHNTTGNDVHCCVDPHMTEPLLGLSEEGNARSESPGRNPCGEAAQGTAAEEHTLAESALTGPQGFPDDPSTPSHSPNFREKLLSPVTVGAEGKIPNAEELVDSESEKVNGNLLLRVATERFTNDVAKASDPNNHAGEHVRASLRDLAAIAQILSDDCRVKSVNSQVIQQNLRRDSDVISDLEVAQKDCRTVDNSTSNSRVPSKLWRPILLAFAQVVWQIAESAIGDRRGRRGINRLGHSHHSVKRSTAMLSCIQVTGEVTTSSPQAHSLFHEAFLNFFDHVLIQFVNRTGTPIVIELIGKIFAEFDQKIHKGSPCLSTGSDRQDPSSVVASGSPEIKIDDAPRPRQSSYKQLVVSNSTDDQTFQPSSHHQDGCPRSCSRSSQPVPDVRRPKHGAVGRKEKKSVRRALYFDSERTYWPEKRTVENTPSERQHVVKRRRTIPTKDNNSVVAEARNRKSLANTARRSQLATKTVELRTTRQPSKSMADVATKRVGSKRPQTRKTVQEPRNDKLVAIRANAGPRRSPRNRKANPQVFKGNVVTDATEQSIGVGNKHTAACQEDDVEMCSPSLRLQQPRVNVGAIVPATPIHKKTSQKEASPNWSAFHKGPVTRSAAAELKHIEENGIPQSPE